MFFKAEHDQIDELLEQIELAAPAEKPKIIKTLASAVLIHFKVEESVLLEQLEFSPPFRKLVREVLRQHAQAKHQLETLVHERDLRNISSRSERLIDLLLDIMEFEEMVLFPKVEAQLSDEELRLLARQLHYEPEYHQAA